MFGKLNTGDIPSLSSHAEALNHWESIKPIRGRRDDERPIGDRRKSHMQIGRNLDTVLCVLYDTRVITFHPDDTITLCVPEEWRSNTTAQFIGAVLRNHVQAVGIRDKDVVIKLKDWGSFRIGTATKFKLVPDGLVLLEGNIVRDVYTVNRKVLNAARKSIDPFLTYQRGSHKVREGLYSFDEMKLLYDFLVEHKQVEASFPFDTFVLSNQHWTLDLPMMGNWARMQNHMEKWHERAKLALKLMREGSHEDWYAISLWLVASSYYLRQNRNVHVDFELLTQDITDLFLVLIPDALIATPEPYGEIKVSGHRHAAAVRDHIMGVKEEKR